jgi:hypothetical protein
VAFAATVYNVLIASPNDTTPSRDAIESALLSWDRDRAEGSSVIMLPRRWETDAVPLVGGLDGQSVINNQLVDQADILFGVFYARLGRATQRGVSGTAEEIERAADAGKPVHVYFSTAPIPRDVDVDQLTALNQFREELATRGLLGEFASDDDLRAKVRSAIEHDLAILGRVDLPRRSGGAGAELLAKYASDREPYMDSKGKLKHKTRHERLIVRNRESATETARGLEVQIQAVGEGDAPRLWNEDGVRPDLPPGAEFSYPLMTYMGVSRAWLVTMSWLDDQDETRSTTQTVTY